MNKLHTLVSVLTLVAAMSFADTGSATTASDSDEITAEGVVLSIADLVIVRPISTAGTVVGFGLFAVSSPFLAMADEVDAGYDVLVAKPGEFTFHRDLGDFNQ
jgi:hypothetical protein